MKHNDEILKVLGSLDRHQIQTNDTIGRLFNLHDESYQRSRNDMDDIVTNVSRISSHLQLYVANGNKQTKASDTGELTTSLTQISSKISEIPPILRDIKKSIDTSMAVNAAVIGAIGGHADAIPNLKSLGKLSQDTILTKLDSMFKMAKKEKESPGGGSAVLLENLKSLGTFIKDFASALTSIVKVQGKVKPSEFANYIVMFIKHIVNIKQKTLEKFDKTASKINTGLTKITGILDHIVEKQDAYVYAIKSLDTIATVIKRMSMVFAISALILPLVPLALLTFKAFFGVSMAIGWFGIRFIRVRVRKGARTIKQVSLSLLTMTGGIWFMGRILKKYDVPTILDNINKMVKIFRKLATLNISPRKTSKIIPVWDAFLRTLAESFVSFDTVFRLLKQYSASEIVSSMDNLQFVLRRSFDLFKEFTTKRITARMVSKSIKAFDKFYNNLPGILKKLGGVSDTIKKKKLDKRAKEIHKTMQPVFDLMKETSNMATNVSNIKSTFLSIFFLVNGIRTVLKAFSKIDEKKLKPAEQKLKVTKRILKRIFQLFLLIDAQERRIRKADNAARRMKRAVTSIFKMSFTFAMIAPLVPLAYVGILFTMFAIKAFRKIGRKSVSLIKMALALTILSPALVLFAGALMLVSGLVTGIDPIKLALSIGIIFLTAKVFQYMGSKRMAKRIAIGSLVVMLMSVGLIAFSIGLLLIGNLLSSVNPLTVLAGIGILALTGIAFALIGSFSTQILLGSLSVIAMGISLIAFSFGLSYLSAAISKHSLETHMIGVLVLAGYALVFGLLGLLVAGSAGTVLLGPLMVAAMGISLMIFANGISALIPVVANLDITQMLLFGLVIIGFSIAFAIAGALSLLVIPGAIAVMLIGISIGVFADGLAIVQTLPEIDIAQMLKFGLTLAVFGIGYAIIGVLGPLIIMGSIAIHAMSSSIPAFINAISTIPELISKFTVSDILAFGLLMATFATGFTVLGVLSPFIYVGSIAMNGMAKALSAITIALQETLKVNWKQYPIVDLKNVLVELASAFATVGADGNTGIGGFITGMLNTVGIGPNNVKKGISSVLDTAKALTSVALGLKAYENSTKDLDFKLDSNGKPTKDSFLEKMTLSVSAIGKVFAEIGGVSNSTSLIKSIFGSDFNKNDTEIGIESVLRSGEALMSVAQGLNVFENMTSDINFDPKDQNSIIGKITKTISMIHATFGGIGGGYDRGLVESIFGFSWGETDVENGIESVLEVGDVFTGIAAGLKSWSDLESQGVDINKIRVNIALVLDMISTEFAKIGKRDSESSGWFTDGDIENGSDAVTGISDTFIELAESLKKWSDLDKQGINVVDISKNINIVLTSISSEFAKIGAGDEFDVDDVAEGIESVKGLGDIMGSIAEGLQVFSNLKKLGFSDDAFDPSKKHSIAWNMNSVLTGVANAFASIGKTSKTVIKDKKGRTIKVIDNVKEGVESVESLGDIVEGIGKGLESFAKIDENKLSTISDNIKKVILTVARAFAEIGVDKITDGKKSSNILNSANVKAGIDAVDGIGDELEGIANSIKPFADLQRGKHKIDLDKVESNMKRMISFGISVIGAIGNAQGQITGIDSFFGIESSNLQQTNVTKGKDVLESASEGVEVIDEIITVTKKLIEGTGILNIDKIGGELKKVVSLTTGIIGAIGMSSSYEEKTSVTSFLGKDSRFFGKYNIRDGVTKLTNVLSGVKTLKELFTIIKDDIFKINDWNNRKKILVDVIGTPFEVLGNLVKRFGHDNMVNNINTFMPLVATNIERVLKVLDQYNYEDTISLLTKDLKNFLDKIAKYGLTKKHEIKIDKFVNLFERFAKIESPFEKFAKTFKSHLKDFKDYVRTLNNLDIDRLTSYNDLNSKVFEISQVNSNQLGENLNMVKTYMIESIQAVQGVYKEDNNSSFFNDTYNAGNNIPQYSPQMTQQAAITPNVNVDLGNRFDEMTIYLKTINDNIRGITDGSKRIKIKGNGRV